MDELNALNGVKHSAKRDNKYYVEAAGDKFVVVGPDESVEEFDARKPAHDRADYLNMKLAGKVPAYEQTHTKSNTYYVKKVDDKYWAIAPDGTTKAEDGFDTQKAAEDKCQQYREANQEFERVPDGEAQPKRRGTATRY